MDPLDEQIRATEDRIQRYSLGGVFLARTAEDERRFVAVFELGRTPSGVRRCLMRLGESPADALGCLEEAVAELAALRGGALH